MKYYHIAGY